MKIRSAIQHRAALWCSQQPYCDIYELELG